MAQVHIYTLTSCNPSEYISLPKVTSGTAVSPLDFAVLGALVYVGSNRLGAVVSARTYTLDYVGTSGSFNSWITNYDLQVTNLVSCADTNKDKFYRVVACGKDLPDRYVFFSAAQTIGNVVVFASETNAWIIT